MKRSFRKCRRRLRRSDALWMPLLVMGVVLTTLLITR
ncbi:hypothetical protein SAMN00790413_03454 [Deinococcus hopiensis KR-140]|uniref:Uncharacterized protein n=1 Tax=Deinococcus hopiensis KR-140 TaxID=695939 RepID=A0A1W1UWN6_9DEIO|nr:hypothetical protein SAMN00790413_03454 [Deinococcus hopiensis KR-140]